MEGSGSPYSRDRWIGTGQCGSIYTWLLTRDPKDHVQAPAADRTFNFPNPLQQNDNFLPPAEGHPPDRAYDSNLSMAANELHSRPSEPAAMTSTAINSPEAEKALGARRAEAVATATNVATPDNASQLDNNNNKNNNNNNEPNNLAEPEIANDDAQQSTSGGENASPTKDTEMGGPEGQVPVAIAIANAEESMVMGDANLGALQPALFADPAVPVFHMLQNQDQLIGMSNNPAALAQMLPNEEEAFMPQPMANTGYRGPEDMQAILPLEVPLAEATPDTSAELSLLPEDPDPTLYQNCLHYDGFPPLYGPVPAPFETKKQDIKGFAKIAFDDGAYYLAGTALMIGRDVAAHLSQVRNETRSIQNPSFRPPRSIISEKGGFVRDFIADEEGNERKRKRKDRNSNQHNKRIKTSRSSGSSSQIRSRRPSMAALTGAPQHEYLDCERPAAVDVERHLPNPKELARLYIHPPAPATAKDWKGISREHLLIKYNFEKGIFEGHVTGKNGVFVEEGMVNQHETFELFHECRFQIGGVEATFILPDEDPTGEREADGIDPVMEPREVDERMHYAKSGKQMSLEFANARDKFDIDDDSDSDDFDDGLDSDHGMASDSEDDARIEFDQSLVGSDDPDSDDREEDGEEEESESEEEEEHENILMDDEVQFDPESLRPEPEPISRPQTPQPKKRGVGRPPKNGISKRQQKENKRLAQEASAKEPKTTSKKEAKVPKAPKKPKTPKKSKESKDSKESTEAREPKEPTEILESDKAKQSIETEAEAPTQEGDNATNKAGADEKRKVGRPRKHPRPDTPEEPREKRKYTKRKPKEPKDGELRVEGEAGEEADKDSREQRQPRSPESPYPTYNAEELTPDQWAKPPQNYVQLIYEALSESKRKQMTLPQIYRALMRKYPYFVLGVETLGWQSSVRHNLGQNEGFQKVARDGKGWKWGLKEGATFEKEKKKKPSPAPQYPPGHVQPIYPGYGPGYATQGYPPQSYPPPGSQGYIPPGMMVPPMGYPMHHQVPQNYHTGQPPRTYTGPMGHQPPANGLYQPGYQPPMYNQPPLTLPPALAPHNTSYSSPYGPKPDTSPSQGNPSTSQSATPAGQQGPSAVQPGASTSPSTTSATQQGLPAVQPGPSTSQPASSTTAPVASPTPQSGSLTRQLGSETSNGLDTTQASAQTPQLGSLISSSTSAGQNGPSNSQMGASGNQAGTTTSQNPQGSSTTPVPQIGYQYARQPQYTPYGQSQHFAQSFTPQQTHPSSQPYQPQPQPQPQQAVPSPSQSEAVQPAGMNTAPAPVSEKVTTAVESFRKALTNEMSKKERGMEALDNAVRKVLGQLSIDTPGVSPDEAHIVVVLKGMLKTIGLQPPTSAPQSQPHPPTNHSGTQASASQTHPPTRSTGSERSSPAIMRPVFAQGQNRSSGNSIPRPPMNNVGRSASNGSSAPRRQQTPVGSPAPPATHLNGASTPVPTSEVGLVDEPRRESSALVPVRRESESELVAEQSVPSSQAAEAKAQDETQS